ncbi:TetR/AcrR family transcriptional regulator [Flavobacterium sp.]|uniref:TetR/AcrR family transcriptional regulator n=1 Tax=Flavobacterium sp. TaxID=239 RepID=UPI002B4B0F2A|nr:TetR/AcrR family transcriptional regulator [Flavobacterium sp.]HLF52627.1 TetR/AcrR family transcriptional regulator [Flavobacterium sp.]
MTKGEQTKQFIIEQAAPIFNTKGIAATSMSDLMESTKLSKGSLYVHFENKDILACAAVDYNMKILKEKVATAINSFTNPKDKLFAYINLFNNPLEPMVVGGCPILNFGSEADDTNETVKLKVNKVINLSQEIIAEIIQEGINAGIFKPTWVAAEFATIMFAMIEGGIMISRMAGNNSKIEVISVYLKKLISDQVV